MAVDADSAQRARCVSCGKWMLVRGGNPCCESCSTELGIRAKPENADAVDAHDQTQCNHCGAYVYFDSPRCPKCGEYIHDEIVKEPAPRRLPRIYVIAAWLVLICMLLPLLLMIHKLLTR